MNERENLPVAITAQNLAATTEKRESLVGRGLVALRNDALYRQAREIFDGKDGVKNWNVGRKKGNNREWNVAKNPAMYSAFKSFKQLANESFGKAYYPLAILYRDRNDIEDGHIHAGYYTRLAFDWCLANQAR